MFVLLTFLSVIWNAGKFKQFELAQIPKMLSLFPKEIIRENLNDLMNDGVNRTIFIQFFGNFPVLSLVYNKFIDLITNQNYTIHSNFSLKISPYLNVNQDLYSINPILNEWFVQNKNQFIDLRSIISNLGPQLCTAFNLDFDVLYHLYNYVFINDENDGVKLGKILDILDIPDDFISELSKILSFLDNQKPIIEMFGGFNAHDEYLLFIEKVRLLRIPDNDERFFSFIRVIDAFSSFVDLVNGIHRNFFVKNEKEVVDPLVKTYLIKPINIFDVSIFDRANALNSTLNTIQSYSSFCTISNSSDIQSIECKIYQLVHQLLNIIICHDNEDDDTCEEEVYERALNVVSDFTDPEVNLTYLLIVKYQIPENYVKFVFGLFENLTSKNKTYIDLLQGLTLIVPENKTISAFHFHDVKFQTFVTNVTDLVNFLINVNDTSNFKLAFEYMNRTEQWNRLRHFVNEISENKTLCDIKKLNEKQCSDMFNSIVGKARKYISNESFINSIPHESVRFVINGVIPFLMSIKSSVSTFTSGLYNMSIIEEGEVNYVDFTTFVKSIGDLFDKIATYIDDAVPILYKKLPFIGDRYRQIVWKSHAVFKVLKKNGQTVSIFYSLFGGLGVIPEMLSNGASAYENGNTTMEMMTKSVKPTTFLNVYDTLLKISELEDLQFNKLAETITYDSDVKSSFKLLGKDKEDKNNKVSFNDILPIKTISENAELLADEMNQNILKLEDISLALGIKKDKLKQRISSLIKKVIATPADTFKEIAIKTGNEKEDVDEFFEKISGFSRNVTMGKKVNLNAKIIKKENNKKRLSTPVIIGIVIAAVVAVSIIIAVTIYLVNKKKNVNNHDLISQQIMLVEN